MNKNYSSALLVVVAYCNVPEEQIYFKAEFRGIMRR